MIANTVSRVFTAAFIIILANHLMPESFGIYNFAFAISYIASVIPEWGFDALLVREVSRRRERGSSMLSDVLFMRTALSAVALFVIFFLYLLISRNWDTPLTLTILMTVAGMLFLERISDSFFAYFRAKDRMDLQSMITVVWKVFYLTLGFLAISLGMSLFPILVFLLISAVIRLLLSVTVYLAIEDKMIEKPNVHRWGDLLKRASPFALITFLGMVYGHLIIVFLVFFGGEYVTGVYSASWKIIVFLGLIPQSFGSALYPLFSRQYASENKALSQTYRHSVKYLLIISLPIAVGLFFTADLFLDIIFISEYGPAFDLLKILVWILPFLFMNASLKMILWAGEMARSAAKNLALATSILGVGGVVLIHLFGAAGAAGIVVIAEIVHFSANYDRISSRFGAISKKILAGPFAASLCMATPLLFISYYMRVQQTLVLAFLVISIFIYISILFLLGMIGRRDIEMIRRLIEDTI